MSKSFAATKRDYKIFHEENITSNEDNDGKKYVTTDANWKLSRHPYGKKKLGNNPFRHTFGSPKHILRLVKKLDKQRQRQMDRNKRRQEFNQLLKEEQE